MPPLVGAAHRAACDDDRARSDWCCTPWAPILLQVSAQGLLPRRGSHSVLPREDHNDDRSCRLRRRQPVRPVPSAWGVDAMGGSMVGGRTAQRSRGGVTSQNCSEGAPHTSSQCSRVSSCGTLVGSRWGEGWGVASERVQHLHTQGTVLQVPDGEQA